MDVPPQLWQQIQGFLFAISLSTLPAAPLYAPLLLLPPPCEEAPCEEAPLRWGGAFALTQKLAKGPFWISPICRRRRDSRA